MTRWGEKDRVVRIGREFAGGCMRGEFCPSGGFTMATAATLLPVVDFVAHSILA